jgi:hypothetical protein
VAVECAKNPRFPCHFLPRPERRSGRLVLDGCSFLLRRSSTEGSFVGSSGPVWHNPRAGATGFSGNPLLLLRVAGADSEVRSRVFTRANRLRREKPTNRPARRLALRSQSIAKTSHFVPMCPTSWVSIPQVDARRICMASSQDPARRGHVSGRPVRDGTTHSPVRSDLRTRGHRSPARNGCTIAKVRCGGESRALNVIPARYLAGSFERTSRAETASEALSNGRNFADSPRCCAGPIELSCWLAF